MECDFDPDDKYSWFFGMLSRDETNKILNPENSGMFLVRESGTSKGDYVLCVKEEDKVSHYIINHIQVSQGTSRFKIGDKEFGDIPSLLSFYKTHFLDTATLVKPAPRTKLLCKYDFAGRDPEDLPFKRGDVLEVICQDEEEWWTARNSNGRVGQIPVRYTQKIEEKRQMTPVQELPGYQQGNMFQERHIKDIQLPALAVVVLSRTPNAYDRRQLRLEKGDILTVTKMNLNGQWEGTVNGRTGLFPFTHVKFLTPEEVSNNGVTS